MVKISTDATGRVTAKGLVIGTVLLGWVQRTPEAWVVRYPDGTLNEDDTFRHHGDAVEHLRVKRTTED